MNVYYLPIASSSWSETDELLLKYVSPQRREKVLQYVHVADRRLSLYAGLTARMALSCITGTPASKLQFRCQPHHKPELADPAGFHFSYSHTRDMILLCISSDGPVGADVEKLRPAPFEIMPHAFHSEEKNYVASASRDMKSQHFFEIWTRKEAYTKQLGSGLVNDLCACNTLELSSILHTWQQGSYCCSVCGVNPGAFHLTELTEKDVQDYFLKSVTPVPGKDH